MGVQEGDEVVTSPFSFVASANSVLFERARPVFVDIDPVTLNLDVDAAAAAITSRTAALLPVHIFGYPADVPALERHGLPIVEDACEALGAVHADGVAVGGRGHPAAFGFYANKQLTTGEGGMLTMGSAEPRSGSTPSATRAARRTWAGSTTTGSGSTTGSRISPARWGWCSSTRLDGMLAARARVAGWYREALAGIEGLELPCEDSGGDVRGWFVFVVQLPHGVDRDDTIRALLARGVQSKPYLPAIHLMSFYREAFGHREGEFPVCEDVAARSVALPFFPEITESQVAEVAEALADVLEVAHKAGPAEGAGGAVVGRAADLALLEAVGVVERLGAAVLQPVSSASRAQPARAASRLGDREQPPRHALAPERRSTARASM